MIQRGKIRESKRRTLLLKTLHYNSHDHYSYLALVIERYIVYVAIETKLKYILRGVTQHGTGKGYYPYKLNEMSEAGLVSIVYSETDKDQHAYQPAMDINKISVGLVLDRLNKLGTTEFIPNFKTEFAPVIKVVADAVKDIIDKESEILLMNLPVNIDGTPTKIK